MCGRGGDSMIPQWSHVTEGSPTAGNSPKSSPWISFKIPRAVACSAGNLQRLWSYPEPQPIEPCHPCHCLHDTSPPQIGTTRVVAKFPCTAGHCTRYFEGDPRRFGELPAVVSPQLHATTVVSYYHPTCHTYPYCIASTLVTTYTTPYC